MTQDIDAISESDIRSFLAGRGDIGGVRKALEIALSMWGYDYHNPIAVLGHNDALVRTMAKNALHEATVAVEKAIEEYRRDNVPAPSREHPFPTAEASAAMERGTRVMRRLRAQAMRLPGLETPMGDGFSRMLRDERGTLENLMTRDIELVIASRKIRMLTTDISSRDLDNSSKTSAVETACDGWDEIVRKRAEAMLT